MSDVSTEIVEVVLPTLTAEEDSFAMAVVEYGGNLGAAYRSVFGKKIASPIRRGQELIVRPEVALRIKKIAEATQEHALISLGSHLLQLATIRDRSLKAGDMRTGLAAEVQRGTVAGFYKDKDKGPQGGGTFVNISFNNPTPSTLSEWSTQFGQEAVVIDNDPS